MTSHRIPMSIAAGVLLAIGSLGFSQMVIASGAEEKALSEKPFNSVTKGVITHIRIQTSGHEYGPPDDRLDAEVIVHLDSTPDEAYGLRMHEGVAPATQAMIELLRESYFRQMPVEIFHTKLPGKKNHTVIWVESEQ